MKRISTATILLLVLQLNGCGLGTEVGNGAKPTDDDDADKKAGNNAEEPVESTDTAAPNQEGQGSDDEDNEGSGETDGTDGGSPVIGVPGSPEGFTVNPSFLVAACASPFAEDYGSNYTLQTPREGADPINVMTAIRSDGQPWKLTDMQTGDLIYSTEKDPSGGATAVKTKNADGQDDDFGYTCKSVKTKTNVEIDGYTGSVTERTVFIGIASFGAEVKWYFVPADGAIKAELIRVEVDDIDGEKDPVRLDATKIVD